MGLRVVFEFPVSAVDAAYPQYDGPVLYDDPVEAIAGSLAGECAEIFELSWGDDGGVSGEWYFDHDLYPASVFVGLVLDGENYAPAAGITGNAGGPQGIPVEARVMEKAVAAVAERFGADVIVVCA